MQLSNDARNTYNVLPLMRDLPERPRFLRLRWRSRDKIPRLNLLHSRQLPKLRMPTSRRSRRRCAATHRVPSVHAAATQWTRSLSQCTVCGKRGHNSADCWDKLDADQSKLDVAKANRDKKKADMASRLAKNQRLTPQLLLLIKPWRRLGLRLLHVSCVPTRLRV